MSTVAMVFVKEEAEWRWWPIGLTGYDGWEYDLSTPENAYRAVLLGIERQDSGGVFDMIDPSMRAGADRSSFVRVASDRLEAIADWEREIQSKRSTQSRPAFVAERPPNLDWNAVLNGDPTTDAQLDAWREQQIRTGRRKEREPAKEKEAACPFVAIAKAPSSTIEVSKEPWADRDCADTWALDPYEGRITSERFLNKDGRWYWQPKSEYTAWPQLNRPSTAPTE